MSTISDLQDRISKAQQEIFKMEQTIQELQDAVTIKKDELKKLIILLEEAGGNVNNLRP